jgi:hypothetical protein
MPVSARLSFDARCGRKDAEAQGELAERPASQIFDRSKTYGALEASKLVASSPGTAKQRIGLILAGSIGFFVELPSNTLGCSNKLRGS